MDRQLVELIVLVVVASGVIWHAVLQA